MLKYLIIILLSFNLLYSQDTTNIDTVRIIEQYSSHKINDLSNFNIGLNKESSISINSDNGTQYGYSYMRIRGIDQTRINYTIDDIPVNEQEDQGFYQSNFPSLINNLKSLSISRGISNSSFGTSGFGGTISMLTNQFDEKVNLNVSVGSFGTMGGDIAITQKIKNNYLTTNLSGYRTEGYRYNSGGSGLNGYFNLTHLFPNSSIRVASLFGKSINQMAWLATSEEDIKFDPRINYNTSNKKDNFNQSLSYIQYNSNKFKSTVYYNKLVGNWNLNLNPNLLIFGLSSDWIGWNGSYTIKSNRITWKNGLNTFYYKRTHTGNIQNEQLYSNYGIKYGIDGFSQLKYKISNDLFVSIDGQVRANSFLIRGENNLTKKNIFINPKIRLDYKSFYLFVGKSNREPTRLDYSLGQDNPTEYRSLSSESVIDIETGYKNKDLSVNLFYMKFLNEINYQGYIVNGFPIMGNSLNSIRTGIEIDYEKQVNHFKFINNLSFCYAKTDSFIPLLTPMFIVNNGIHFNKGVFSFEVFNKYQSSSFISFEDKIKGFDIINTKIGITKDYYSINLIVNNVTNSQYYTNGYVIDGVKYLYTNAGTNFQIQLVYDFN